MDDEARVNGRPSGDGPKPPIPRGQVTTHIYDVSAGYVRAPRTGVADPSVFHTFTYTYDTNGNVT